MFARLLQMALPDEGLETEVLTVLSERSLPALQDVPGFIGGYLLASASGSAVILTLWSDGQAYRAAEPMLQASVQALEAAGAQIEVGPQLFETVVRAGRRGVLGADELPD